MITIQLRIEQAHGEPITIEHFLIDKIIIIKCNLHEMATFIDIKSTGSLSTGLVRQVKLSAKSTQLNELIKRLIKSGLNSSLCSKKRLGASQFPPGWVQYSLSSK